MKSSLQMEEAGTSTKSEISNPKSQIQILSNDVEFRISDFGLAALL
jgi:hypothetical protein